MSRVHLITAIGQSVERGSGCYVATRTLARGMAAAGIDVDTVVPSFPTPIFLATRLLFNESLRVRRFDGDATIGIDADGYSLAGGSRRWNALPHVACIKGVLGDAVRFEKGATRASLAIQARLEALNARRADLVITISRYCAERLAELYGVGDAVVVPELIDLVAWRQRFQDNAALPDPRKFTVLSVCRFYPRKRLDILLRAAALLRDRIPALAVRIVGNGPERGRLLELARELGVEAIVQWLGDVSIDQLAKEYNRADVFCLPSAQEGFGLVFLEAMAAGKPIVAAHAAAVPEVVRHGVLVEPENPEAFADALLRLERDPDQRRSLGAAGSQDVERFEMHRVTTQFLGEVARLAPGVAPAQKLETEFAV